MFDFSSIFRIFTGAPDPTNYNEQYYHHSSVPQNALMRREGYSEAASSGWGGPSPSGWSPSPGWGDGWKDDGWSQNPIYSQDGQTSPAVSALTLLAFLFLLGMIQNSLNLNQQLLTTTVVTSDGGTAASTSSSSSTSQSSSSSSSVSGAINGDSFVNSPMPQQPAFQRVGKRHPNRIKRSPVLRPPNLNQFDNATRDLILRLNHFFTGVSIIGNSVNSTMINVIDTDDPMTRAALNDTERPPDKAQPRDTSQQSSGSLSSVIQSLDILTLLRCLQMVASSCHVARNDIEKRVSVDIKKIFKEKLINKIYTKLSFKKKLLNALILKFQTKKLCFLVYKQCVVRNSLGQGWSH